MENGLKVQKAKTILRQWDEWRAKARSENLTERLRAEKKVASLAAYINEARSTMAAYDERVEKPKAEMINKLIGMIKIHEGLELIKVLNGNYEEIARHMLNAKGMKACQEMLDKFNKVEIVIPGEGDVERIAAQQVKLLGPNGASS